MDHLWTPWRSTYMEAKKEPGACVFCEAAKDPANDERTLVVFRGEQCVGHGDDLPILRHDRHRKRRILDEGDLRAGAARQIELMAKRAELDADSGFGNLPPTLPSRDGRLTDAQTVGEFGLRHSKLRAQRGDFADR